MTTTARSTPSRPKSSSAWLIPFDVSTPAHAARNPTRRTGSCRACAAASVSSRSHAKTVFGSVKTIPSRSHHVRSSEFVVGSACALTPSSLVKLELGKRAAGDPLLEVVARRAEQPLEHLAPLGRTLDRPRPRGQDDPAVGDPRPDLDALRLPAARAGRRDVDRAVAAESILDAAIHSRLRPRTDARDPRCP